MKLSDHEVLRLWEATWGQLEGVRFCCVDTPDSVDDALNKATAWCWEALGDEFLRVMRRELARNLAGRRLVQLPVMRFFGACDLLIKMLCDAAGNTIPEVRDRAQVVLVFRESMVPQRAFEEVGRAVKLSERDN